jgi:hypothetical protein
MQRHLGIGLERVLRLLFAPGIPYSLLLLLLLLLVVVVVVVVVVMFIYFPFTDLNVLFLVSRYFNFITFFSLYNTPSVVLVSYSSFYLQSFVMPVSNWLKSCCPEF